MTDDELRRKLDDLRRLTIRTQQQDVLLALLAAIVERVTDREQDA